MVECGRSYVHQQSVFANSLWEIAICFKGDEKSVEHLKKLSEIFHDIGKYQNVLLDQATKTIVSSLNTFLKE